MVDETCVAANFDMLSGFHPGGGVGKGIVGGGFSADPNSDWSYLLPQHHSLSALPEKHKSKLVMSVVLTRNDTNKMTFDVCCSSQELECFFLHVMFLDKKRPRNNTTTNVFFHRLTASVRSASNYSSLQF